MGRNPVPFDKLRASLIGRLYISLFREEGMVALLTPISRVKLASPKF
jgi:hypothetical protein